MWIFTIIIILTAAAFISYCSKEDISDTLPMTVAGFLLMLYVFAFFGILPLTDWLSMLLLLAGVIFLGVWKKEKRNRFLKSLMNSVFSPKCIVLLLIIVLVTFLTRDRIAIWWDDINFWATDAKALYYTGSFSGKYGNVAPEFGDYPPIIQLMKWWFLQTDSEKFTEGLMFAAYYCMNMIFLLPLLKKIQGRNPVWAVAGCLGIFLLPGIADSVAFQGTCADVTMGIVYGALLLAIWDDTAHNESFYYTRIGLYIGILVLTKSVGIEWAAFAILFLLLKKFSKKNIWNISKIILAAGAAAGSWLGYCFLQRRVAKLTSTGIKLAVGGKFTLPDNLMDRMKIFLKGFSLYPMHTEKTWAFDLSALQLLILIFLALFVMKKTKMLTGAEWKKIFLFTVITAFTAYSIIFLGHLTIFAGELQYDDPAVMAISIARYGAPFAIGMLYLLCGITVDRLTMKKGYLICIAAIMLTTFYPGYYRALIGYRDTLAADTEDRAAMIEEDSAKFLEQLEDYPVLVGKRTLYLRNDHVIHWVKDTYVNYQASPVAVVYNGIATDTMSEQEIGDKIRQSHATYLYVDEVEGDATPLFTDMLEGETFEYECFYRITEEQGRLVLKRLTIQEQKVSKQ